MMPHRDREAVSRKIAKVTREEKRKPPGKRRSRKAILGKAFGTLRGKHK